jgi:LysM repeat protein
MSSGLRPDPRVSSSAMAGRSPARFIAPLALVGFALALFIVVTSTTKEQPGEPGTRGTPAPAEATPAPNAKKQRKTRKNYTIKSGDTPSGIAVKVGVPLDQILELNPDLDPQTLTPGTKIKLR